MFDFTTDELQINTHELFYKKLQFCAFAVGNISVTYTPFS